MLPECVYCGRPANFGADHIPPRNLFPAPRPSNLITVPSCQSCNQGADKDDEYFRLVVLPREGVADHEQAARVWPAVRRALVKPRKQGLTRRFLKSFARVRTVTLSGLHLGDRVAYEVDLPRLSRVAARIVRGLFFRETGHRLPDDYAALAFEESGFLKPPDLRGSEAVHTFVAGRAAALRAGVPTVIGDGVFAYWWRRGTEDDNYSECLLAFYESTAFFGLTVPKAQVPPQGNAIGFP
jgi:hypothetical protein